MAIRIAGKPRSEPVPEAPEAMPEDMLEALPEEAELPQDVPIAPAKFSADKVDPMVARYMTSDMGPFICANCDHFTEQGDCDVVSGPIDPEGVCILFTPPDAGETELEGVAEDVAPVEPEIEEPVEDVE